VRLALMPEDAREAIGHGVKAKRSKSGAVSFDVLETEATHAPPSELLYSDRRLRSKSSPAATILIRKR
jgi:hypothetical protein